MIKWSWLKVKTLWFGFWHKIN